MYGVLLVKTVPLCAVIIFEIGSTIFGAFPPSLALVLGRGASGIDGVEIFAGCVV
jgi:hypothetical protein